MSQATLFGVGIGGTLVFVVISLLLIRSWWHPVPQGQALIVNGPQGEPKVSFTGLLIIPIVNKAETIDLSVRQIVIDRRGREGVICRDNIRADVQVRFFVRVDATAESIVRVARTIGCARASEQAALDVLFNARFSEAIKTVGKRYDFEELYTQRGQLKDDIIAVVGEDLNGFRLDDVVIDALEQTPLEALDPQNVLDAQGIKKILSRTADLDRLPRRAAAAGVPASLQAELERLGLLDVRVTTEVSCDVAGDSASLAEQIDDDTDASLARLPPGVPRNLVSAVGRGALIREAGRATFRWTQADVTAEQLIAGARLVRSLRDDARAYR